MTATKFNGTLASEWGSICPRYQPVQDLVFGTSTNATISEVQAYLSTCAVIKHTGILQMHYRLNGIVSAVLAGFGLLGSLLTMITLTRTKSVYFQASTYKYFRILVLVQSLVMIGSVHESVRNLTNDMDRGWYGWYLVTIYVEPLLTLVCSSWAEGLVCYLSFERAVACLFPSIFQKLNGKRCFRIVIFTSFLGGCFCDLPFVAQMTVIFDPNTRLYTTAPRTQATTAIVSTIRVVSYGLECFFLVVATCAAIVGFHAAYKRKQRLQQNQAEWQVTAQLCTLQLIQAFPAIAGSLTAVAGGIGLNYTIPNLDTKNLASATDAQISAVFDWYETYYRTIEWFTAVRILGHSAHFYLYYAFSRPFRMAARNAIYEIVTSVTMVKELPRAETTNIREGQSIKRAWESTRF